MPVPIIAAAITAGGAYAASRSQSRAASNAADAQTRLAEEQAALAREQWDYYRQNYQPLEQQLIGDARDYDSPERREAAANSAMADQQREFDQATQQVTNRFASMGLNPADGRFQSGLQDLAVAGAANKAGAANLARRAVEQEGWNRRLGVAALGRNIPAQVSGTMSAAQHGLASSAAANAAGAARTAGGVTYLADKIFSDKNMGALSDWWNKPNYSSGIWGASGPGE